MYLPAGCLAHARRRFVAALEAGDLRAAIPLRRIQQVYLVERRAQQDGCDAQERLRRRQQHSEPLMTQLRQQAEALGAQAPPKTPLGRAITYLLRQWGSLQRRCELLPC
ncbi:MAG: transposase [Polyangia bacterium]